MPLINQYFKNHCLYFLSTPAKVLGSGGHSSNKEKEMIARWSLSLYIYIYVTHRNVMPHIVFINHPPPSLFYQFFLEFSFPSFSLLLIVVSSVKCLLWWDTEFLSLVSCHFLLIFLKVFTLFYVACISQSPSKWSCSCCTAARHEHKICGDAELSFYV